MMTLHEKWISYKTIVRKDTFRFMRLWVQTLLPSVITTALYFLIFGYALGHMIRAHGDVPYGTFIAPGLIILAMVNSAFSGSSFSFYIAKFNRTIDDIIVSPTPLYLVLAAYMSIGMIRGTFTAILVGLISYCFTGFHIHMLSLAIGILILTGAIFSCVGIISGIYSNNFDQVSILPNFVLTPLIYLGGVFYSIQMLPFPWKTLSMLNPIYYIVSAFRHVLLGTKAVHLVGSLCAITLMLLFFFVFAVKLFKSRVGNDNS